MSRWVIIAALRIVLLCVSFTPLGEVLAAMDEVQAHLREQQEERERAKPSATAFAEAGAEIPLDAADLIDFPHRSAHRLPQAAHVPPRAGPEPPTPPVVSALRPPNSLS
ncbi:MAG: hypothetical protein J0H69_14590 [Burkholderiales bacterium]|nr:hypothetical protein [Burkholderiales bacterium]